MPEQDRPAEGNGLTPALADGRRPTWRSSIRGVLPLLVCSALSGLLIYLSFPPAGVGVLAFVALVPFLAAVGRTRSYRAAAICGAVAGAVAYLPAFAWLASVALIGWLGIALYVTLYLAAAAVGVRLFQRTYGALWPVMAAILWVALELVRARLGPGFPWLFLGYTQYEFAGLLQLAAAGGVYAVSFVVFFCGAAVAALTGALVNRNAGVRRVPAAKALLTLAAAVLLLILCAARGGTARERLALSEGPVVGVVQQNIPRLMSEIFAQPANQAEAIQMFLDSYRKMDDEIRKASELTGRLRNAAPRLVLWPETTVQVPLNVSPDHPDVNAYDRQLIQNALAALRSLGREMGCHLLVGAPCHYPRAAGYVRDLRYGTDVRDFGNSAVLFSPQGQFVERYDKIRLVPFGEYIPLRDVLPFMTKLTPIPRELTPGDKEVVFTLPGRDTDAPVKFATLICYEDVFPDLTASFRRRGADFLCNLSDEGWYHIPGELGQHLAMAVFRAVETRTTVVRAANTGISCFINPRGEVYAALDPLTEGALSAPVQLCDAVTPYVTYGDTFAIACLMLSIILPAVLLALRGG